MLIITRRPVESIDCTLEDGRRIVISVLGVKGNQVRIGVETDRTIVVDRHEITIKKWKELHPEEVNGNVA